MNQPSTNRQRLCCGLLALALLPGCESESTTPANTELLDWHSEGHFSASGFTQGDESLEADQSHTATVVVSPEPLTGFFDPTLEDLRIAVTYTTGVRTMHRPDGTSFTARVPLSLRAVTGSETHWTTTTRCEDSIASPMPRLDEAGNLAYLDGTIFWQACSLTMRRGESLQYGASLEARGDGRIEASAAGSAVTISH